MFLPNELIFIFQATTVAIFTLTALWLGKEALTATVCLYCILSNLFVTKQITLFGLSVVSTDVFAVGSILGLNLMQEYFGLSAARKAIGINAVLLLFYLASTQLFLAYAPNSFDTMNQHFIPVLTHMPRIIIASALVYFFVQLFDAQLYRFFKTFFKNRFLVGRNVMSLLISQLLDTVLFTFAGLYGIIQSPFHVIIISYTIKIIVIMCSAPFVSFAKRIITTDKTQP